MSLATVAVCWRLENFESTNGSAATDSKSTLSSEAMDTEAAPQRQFNVSAAALEVTHSLGEPEARFDAGREEAPPSEPQAQRQLEGRDPAVFADDSPPSPHRKHDDARFRIRWSDPGYCDSRRRPERTAARDAMLATFSSRTIADATLLYDNRIDQRLLAVVAERLQFARAAAGQWFDWPPNAAPPITVVYASTRQLQSVGCVNEQTIGYFDGRLHVSADPNLSERLIGETVVHEYTHFALNQQSISKPMWLHEGLAMHLAEESWFQAAPYDLNAWLRHDKLPFDAMVFAFPHTADEKFALAAYFQSHRMVAFVQHTRGPTGIRELIRRLSANPEMAPDAFRVGTGLTPPALEAAWDAFVR